MPLGVPGLEDCMEDCVGFRIAWFEGCVVRALGAWRASSLHTMLTFH